MGSFLRAFVAKFSKVETGAFFVSYGLISLFGRSISRDEEIQISFYSYFPAKFRALHIPF